MAEVLVAAEPGAARVRAEVARRDVGLDADEVPFRREDENALAREEWETRQAEIIEGVRRRVRDVQRGATFGGVEVDDLDALECGVVTGSSFAEERDVV